MIKTEQEVHEEIIRLAEVLSSRYKSSQYWDDLVQEGIVTGLQTYHKLASDNVVGSEAGNEVDMSKVSGDMRRAIFNHRNYSYKPTELPKSGIRDSMRRRIVRGEETPQDLMSPLYLALLGHTADPSDEHLQAESSHSADYEHQEHIEMVWSTAKDILSSREYEVLVGIYHKGLTHSALSEEMGVPKSNISLWLKGAISDLKKVLKV